MNQYRRYHHAFNRLSQEVRWLCGSTCPNALYRRPGGHGLVLRMEMEGHSNIERPIFHLQSTAQIYIDTRPVYLAL